MTGLSLLKRVSPSLLLWSVLLTLSAFLVADIVNRLIEIRLAPPLPGSGVKRIHTIPSRSKSLKDLLKSPQKSLPTPPPSPPLSLKLVGTVIGKGIHSYAFFEDHGKKKQFVVRAGEAVKKGVLLKEVRKDGVILSINGRESFLPLGEGREKEKAQNLQRSEGEGKVLTRHEVEGAFRNLKDVMTQARVIPYTVDGRLIGYRIFSIRPGSIYSRAGLQNGDIIQRVNGVELTTPEKAYLLFQQLRNEARITIDLLRAGRRITIPIEIR